MSGVLPDAGQGPEPSKEIVAGRYRLQELVGRGGMGAVHRAVDQNSGRTVALKRLIQRGDGAQDALSLFEREYHTLAQLSHPRIIEVYDYGRDEEGAFYTMELLAGADMRELSPLPWPTACRYLREVATTLALLHARRLVHRDVSPRNVRLTPDGHCKLIDFGVLARIGDEGAVIGTPPCLPPEAMQGLPVHPRVDIYALGCLAYWMLTGRHAYPATDWRQLPTFWARKPEPPSALRPQADRDGRALPEVPARLDALVLSSIAHDPMVRPTSAAAVIDRLDVILGWDHGEERSLAESYLSSAPLVGRKPEVDEMRHALLRVCRGRGFSLLVSAPAGTGRTRLLFEMALSAQLAGVATLRADAEAQERPFGVAIALATQLLELLPDTALDVVRRHVDVLWHLIPGVDRRLRVEAPQPPSVDPIKWRNRCQAALRELFLEVSAHRPLALLVDDLHRADEPSSALLALLARAARHLPLLIVASVRDGDEQVCPTALHDLAQAALRLQLEPLSEAEMRSWLGSVFGDAERLPRMSQFLHVRSAGVPAAAAELLHYLLERGELRYLDGTWLLPNEPATLTLPRQVNEALLARLEPLDDKTRELAHLLSMQRAAVSVAQCEALQPDCETSVVQERIEQLSKAGVVARVPGGVRIANEALRDLLQGSVPEASRAGFHRRVADAMLRPTTLAAPQKLAAGLHLIDASDDRGSDLVVEAALSLCSNQDDLRSCVRMLEQALERLRERRESAPRLLPVLAALGLGAYLVDRRLDRHEEALAETLDAVSGLGLARRLSRFLGPPGELLGLGLGLLRQLLRPRRDRPCGPMDLIQFGAVGLVALAGKCSVCLDKAGIDRVVTRLAPLRLLGKWHMGAFARAFCIGLAKVTEDRYARTEQYMRELESRLLRPGSLQGLNHTARRLLASGLNYALGVFEGFRGHAGALQRALALESSGLDLDQLVAAQLRLQYHGFRGEAEQVRRAFEQMEAYAIQAGSGWQVEIWSAITINLFATTWGDVILAKRAMDETERILDELPSVERYAITSRAAYLLLRGQPRDCADIYDRILPNEPPQSRIGWSVSHGLWADALNQLGQHERARALCEKVFATVDPQDAAYYAMRIAVELPYATALASLGEHEAAQAHLDGLLERYEPTGSPLVLGLIHENHAQVAWMRRDRKRFTRHLKQVEKHFAGLGNPALIARFQRLTDVAGEEGGMATRIATMREVNAFDAALSSVEELSSGARQILAWLMDRSEGFDGYLFARGSDEPELLAATTDRDPPAETYAAVSEAIDTLGKASDATNFGTAAATQRARDDNSCHLYLLGYPRADAYHGEGALVLLGPERRAPKVRFELLQAAALQLERLRVAASDGGGGLDNV